MCKLRSSGREDAGVEIRPLVPADWPAVAAIYRAGVDSGNATFETEVPDWEQWDASRLPAPRLVAVEDGRVAAWAALAPVSRRPVYRGVADVGIYVAPAAQGRGIGRSLLRALVEQSAREGIWTLQAGVFPENVASLALHRSCGFREVGVRERIGAHHGVWRDVVLLERRSDVVI